ncbi:hypothetical protein [Tsukamurella ocularis]|uniref:hypothetical protein n=1 Tax=Tsukamurella ocularis TaxID=1970234 RepID=UPI00216A5FBF|nr:hypothetical protein [Tsukamurella ocularis]MCS3853322.1 hypothetical protein [Tsukamurella ocularis]
MSPTGSISLGLDTSTEGTNLYTQLTSNASEYIRIARSLNDQYNTDSSGKHVGAYLQVNEKLTSLGHQSEELFGTNAQQQTANRAGFEESDSDGVSSYTQYV